MAQSYLHGNSPGENSAPRTGPALLSISPLPEDYTFLRLALPALRIYSARTYREGVACLRRFSISVVICECDLPDGNWKDLISFFALMPDAPPLIVTSRLADERMWAEVLNLGAYDLLVKPFDGEEVRRVVALTHPPEPAYKEPNRAQPKVMAVSAA